MTNRNIMVLGGAGYIGSHTCFALKLEGYTPIIVDNFSRGHKALCGENIVEDLNILQTRELAQLFRKYNPEAILHFAALSEVGESMKNPELYFKNNVEGTRSVLDAMVEEGQTNIIFSSTAAVYGQPEENIALDETQPLAPMNPYGESKLRAENLIRSYEEHSNIRSVCLRYFNAAGAQNIINIGEAHFPETHLVPLVIQAALGLRDGISVFGDNYDTKDGSCIRDYIHVSDLALAHVKALQYLTKGGVSLSCNLGTGFGYSVLEIIETVQKIAKQQFNVIKSERRDGDPAYLVADSYQAQKILNWTAELTLEDIITSAYDWHGSDKYQALWAKYNA